MLTRLFNTTQTHRVLNIQTRYFARKVSLTQPQPTLHDQVTKFFGKLETSKQMMSMDQLTDFMSKTFLHRHFTYQEHSTIGPVIEELVVYSKMLGFDPKDVSLNQAVTLLKFGNTF